MRDFWEQHWDKIITILLSSAFTAVVTFFITIMGVNDKIERAKDTSDRQILEVTEKLNNQISVLKDQFNKELAAVRSECNKNKTKIGSHISKLEKGMSKVEECVYGYLKPHTEAFGPLKTEFEILKKDFAYLREKFSSDMKIANSLINIDSTFKRLMQADDFKQSERRTQNTVNKTVAMDGT